MKQRALEYAINHLFLPPKLPQEDDSADVESQRELMRHIADCARQFCDGLREEAVDVGIQECWDRLHNTLVHFSDSHFPTLTEDSLQAVIDGMQLNDVSCFHIVSQNAGVILRHNGDKGIFVEFFQASPSAALVTGTQGKLVIRYPSRPRLLIPLDTACVRSISALLADLSSTETDAMPTTRKAGQEQVELRDVADIRYISELFGAIARNLTPADSASHIASSTVYATKRVNDHVLWKDALLPWRRSPKWLIVRVALQTTLAEWKVPDEYYKVFIAFVMAKTLELALSGEVNSVLLFVMKHKIAARMWKLRTFFKPTQTSATTPSFPLNHISDAMSSVDSYLRRCWAEVRALEPQRSAWEAPNAIDLDAAQRFTLPQSASYLEIVRARSRVFSVEPTVFDSTSFEARLREKSRRQAKYEAGISSPDLWLAVVGLEEWVSSSSNSATLSKLSDSLMYHNNLALSFKSRNPEIFSRIFLAVLEIWVALDKKATEEIPLLLYYSPELAIESFEPLLLPELSQMQRLRGVEIHLRDRHARAIYPDISVFSLSPNSNSLPSRYFTRNSRMQVLRAEIETEASDCKIRKREERRSLSDKHTLILQEARQRDHEYRTDRRGRTHHDNSCHRCRKDKEAAAMRISLFEWPVPEDTILQQLVLFELCVPEAFGIWRDATYWFACSHGPDIEETSQPAVVLQDYTFLSRRFVPHSSNPRITIASTAKSFLKSHYQGHNFPCRDADIIQNHPLRYQLWDMTAGKWLPSTFPMIDIRGSCTPNFPSGPYRSLEWTACGTTHTPNEVIARQSRCPVELSYHEWESFGHLRAGVRLQYRNIILQLVSGRLNLADPAVHLLFQQAIWQAETAISEDADFAEYRAAHLDLAHEDFGSNTVRVLNKRLDSIAGNWKEGWTAATLVAVACRLFSLSPSGSVKAHALSFLCRIRQVLFTWMKDVSALLNKPLGLGLLSVPKVDLVHRVLQLAASCRQTFAVGSDRLREIFRDDDSITIFMRCAITLHTNAPQDLQTLQTPPSALRYLLERDVATATEALESLRLAISRNGKGLDNAVVRTWEGFHRDSAPWREVGERWVACTTFASSDRQNRTVYLNLVTGFLLVDGHAQGTLPKQIVEHSLFKRIFPNRSTLDIIPSTMKGMDYQSRENIEGFEVHFKLNDDLMIRIRDGSNSVSEFIPPECLEGDLPNDLMTDMVHVFCELDQRMYIHHAPSGWLPHAPVAWTLDFASRLAFSSSEKLLDPKSFVVQQLAGIFRPLESCETNIVVSIGPEKLHIRLPRYSLEFSVAGDRLESKELPGFYVSAIQSIRTLIGLQNKLVLKSTNGEMAKVFIPDGKITISGGDSEHPAVAIAPSPTARHIKAFSYDVDNIVGRLVGDGSLTSWYRLSYLHIATTSHFPDPLLRRTGLQEGQDMLRSAQAFAFMALEAEDCAILQQIIDLSPIRQYYPTHLTSMETVEWHESLSVLVQCGRFVPLVNAIVDYAQKQAIFQASPQPLCVAYKGKLSLWDRANVRGSRLVSSDQLEGFDYPVLPTRCFDSPESIRKEHMVAQVVSLFINWPQTAINNCLWKNFERWAKSAKFSSELMPDNKVDNPRIWLCDPPSEVWFRLFHLCKASLNKERDQYGLMVAFGILAYREDIDPDLIRCLLALATNSLSQVNGVESVIHAAAQMPMDTFDLPLGHTLTRDEVLEIVTAHCHDSHPDPNWLPQGHQESHWDWHRRKQKDFLAQKNQQCRALADNIFLHWPAVGSTPPQISHVLPDSSAHRYPIVKIADLRPAVESLFREKLRNRGLYESTKQLQRALDGVRGSSRGQAGSISALALSTPSVVIPPQKYVAVTLSSLLSEREPPIVRRTSNPASPPVIGTVRRESKLPSLARQLIFELTNMTVNGPKLQYVAELSRCVDAFESPDPATEPDLGHPAYQQEPDFEAIRSALSPRSLFERLLHNAGQWPTTGQQCLLHQLSQEQWAVLSEPWKVVFLRYAEGLGGQQQRRRIEILGRLGLETSQETGARGGRGWNPSAYPDWLLVQLDADLLIRSLQAAIAEQMMFPKSHNALMQLNMGEGKSSVIVPIISSALANGTQLVRVVVLKPLAAQMFQLLKQRVCGLANRRLFYLPFSRDIHLDSTKIQQIFALFKECAESGGILLCQPEHILSLKLKGLNALTQSEDSEETRMLMEVQDWLNNTARDILDESDEILNVRYQLIYTVGTSRPLEGRPWRWNITQAVFSLLQAAVKTVPDGLEVARVGRSCQFPATRILTREGGRVLIDSLIHRIVFKDGFQEWISFRNYSEAEKHIVSRFLRQPSGDSEDERVLRNLSGDRFNYLLLLRGLFAHGILDLSLREKRWRVDYGLDPRRSMLAVPYRAKDSPAPRAEFGHPDMIIVLTCLSYYYGGLTDDQLEVTFRLLMNSDNPEAQYEEWVKDIEDLPATLANLRGLNLDDFEQKTQTVFPLLRFNKAVVDFYLSECVFPKEAQEFQHKLTANAWDLARKTEKSTTGFSGTNDNKYLLPLSIEQRDQPPQLHTNAQVLDYILQEENRAVFYTDCNDVLGLLRCVVQQDPPVMVLLDVGAQVLELQNVDVAREWLNLDHRGSVEAAVYFDPSTDEIRVISRNGRIQPFASSLYKKQLEKTLVYLDEAHTRGTDFKFPPGSRAVVTLGPRLTKDKLVQGCMRMRRLGKDHSVLFFASAEIRTKITATTGVKGKIDSMHVLLWTIHETCVQIRDNGALWANQGLNFDARTTALEQYRAGGSYDTAVAALQERESRTLEELYGVAARCRTEETGTSLTQLQSAIMDKRQKLGIAPSDTALSEEQERELAHEKEDEREVERVAPAKAALHHADDLRRFITTGTIGQPNRFISLENCLTNTSWISLLPPGKTFRGSKLLATKDFRDTIILPRQSAGSMDQYLRAVQWVMSSKSSDVLILVSPFEANEWLPEVRRSKFAYLHLYSPRISRNTFWPMDKLDSFTVPAERSDPIDERSLHELNLFAGQLFCANKSSMQAACDILGLHFKSVSDRPELLGMIDSSGFVQTQRARAALGIQGCSFTSTPLPFFRELVGARRKGQGFALTHMGQILRGNEPKDPSFEGDARVTVADN
ncbi:hypothetical protein B0H16DRAFT_1407125 [Mycena metata]|uniref:ubiquitinyl hydrolase 1 n=1 Tax=Mycena metata TaxID=1033252 RepID=A0AAD7K5G2_9AGAR|nr:hypothetical protein B0H16DRAFT_1407125 [Mycena metata]